MDNFEEIQKELDEKALKLETVNILFLDISSSCTGYSIATVNFKEKSAKFTKAGCLWLNSDWSHQEKYCYMSNAIQTYFWIVEAIDYIVVEQYSVNPKKMAGVNVVSEMQGAIKCAAWENGVKVTSILPQTWRSVLKIKKNAEGDYKLPTKERILELTSVPEEVFSNVTKQARKTPSDVYDALAIGIAWLKKLGIEKQVYNITYNSHIGLTDK